MRRARQGVPTVLGGAVDVWDGEGAPVPRDGSTMGEVVLRGNTVMAGYLDDSAATAEAFRGGWLHSGDAAVIHPDGRIEVRDRFKDVIVSGGENISTIEVEQALARHPAVLECAVVGIPDDRWGERPKAFVEVRPGHGGAVRRSSRRSATSSSRGSSAPTASSTAACRARRPGRCRSSCCASANGPAASAGSTERWFQESPRRTGSECTRMRAMGGIRTVALILAGLLLAAPASAGTGSELRGVIQRTEQLRGLGATRPLAVTTVDAAGMRRVVLRELARERQPRVTRPGTTRCICSACSRAARASIRSGAAS